MGTESKKMRDINTPKELYEYCLEKGAENWKIKIRERRTVNVNIGIWLVTSTKEVLIVIPSVKY